MTNPHHIYYMGLVLFDFSEKSSMTFVLNHAFFDFSVDLQII